ncbi:hypothetical protein GCM10027294_48160 [Marinactinospora endophytica]
MDLVWLGDDVSSGSLAAPGWVLARGLAERGHRVSWILRDDRCAPRSVDGVRLCPFPYDEREWPPGEGLYWGLVRLLGREVPVDTLIVDGGRGLRAVARRAVAARGLEVRVRSARSMWERDGQDPPPFPVPLPPHSPAPAAGACDGEGPIRVVAGALGSPADLVDLALPVLHALAEARIRPVELRFAVLNGRDALWEGAAALSGSPGFRGTVPLWGRGFDEGGLWRLLAESDRYLSLTRGFDMAAGAAALHGTAVVAPRDAPCPAAARFDGPHDLARSLTEPLLPSDPAAVERLRTRHAGAAVLDAWEKGLW